MLKDLFFLALLTGWVRSICPGTISLNDIEWISQANITGSSTASLNKVISSQISNQVWMMGDDGTGKSGASVWTVLTLMSYTQNITWQNFYNFYAYNNALIIDSGEKNMYLGITYGPTPGSNSANSLVYLNAQTGEISKQ